MSVAPPPRTRGKGLEHREGPCGAALPHVAGHSWHSPRFVPPHRSPSHHDAVVHFKKPRAPGRRWNPRRWVRRGPGPSETRRSLGIGELMWYGGVAPGRSFSTDDIHRGYASHHCGSARYVKRIVAGARFVLQVARGPPPRLDLGEHSRLASVDIGKRSQTEGEGPMTRRYPCRALARS
jgi:hypothetical protein